MDADALLEAWEIHSRINLYFLSAVSEDALYCKSDKAKTVCGHFTHMHNVRRMWLEAATSDLAEGVAKLPSDAAKDDVEAALTESCAAIRELLRRGFEEGRIKGFKPSAEAFFAYLVSHESFHRGQAELVLRQAGFPLDEKVAFGMWEWGVR